VTFPLSGLRIALRPANALAGFKSTLLPFMLKHFPNYLLCEMFLKSAFPL
jgi:hypothetical protein